MAAIGHGSAKEMSAAEALEVAKNAEPATPEQDDPGDPQGLKPGMNVSVIPCGDGGDPAVTGTVRAVSRDTIAMLREDDRVGQVCVHFPRAGYRVSISG